MTGGGRAHWLVVDRLEGEMVAVEVDGGAVLDLPRWLLPPDLREGDVVRAEAAGGEAGWRVELRVDREETESRRAETAARLERLRARDPGGDVVL